MLVKCIFEHQNRALFLFSFSFIEVIKICMFLLACVECTTFVMWQDHKNFPFVLCDKYKNTEPINIPHMMNYEVSSKLFMNYRLIIEFI